MKEQGTVGSDRKAPEGAPAGEELPQSFWNEAVVEEPRGTRSVHLRLDREVFDHFVEETGGKGHLTRMQAVLRAYVRAKRKAS